MQRGARFLFFGERSMVQEGVDEGVKNIYKTNAIIQIRKVKCTPPAATKWVPKSKICKTAPENKGILGAVTWGEAPQRLQTLQK